MPVRRPRFLDFLVWMLHNAAPLGAIHERPRFGLAWWDAPRMEIAECLPGYSVLCRVIALGADTVEVNAEAVIGRLPANRTVPAVVVPSHPNI
jgi:hypothetical protein